MQFLSIYWNVDPVLFSLGPFHLRYYGIMFILAFTVGSIIFWKILKEENKPQLLFLKTLNTVFLSMLIGARLGECLFYYPSYFLHHPWQILFPFVDGKFVGFQGLSSHGAAIGIFTGLFILAKSNKLSFLWLLDRVSLVVAIGAVFIRIGNLFNSELYGTVTTMPWGFEFVRKGETIARHPVQLYEALAYLAVFIVLYRLFKKSDITKTKGLLFGLFLILIFTARFLLEYFKEPVLRSDNDITLQIGQYLSLPFIFIGAILLIVLIMRSDKKDNNNINI